MTEPYPAPDPLPPPDPSEPAPTVDYVSREDAPTAESTIVPAPPGYSTYTGAPYEANPVRLPPDHPQYIPDPEVPEA